ncbi:MAG: hypothetical protein ACYC7A_22350 [Thermoanaerobaculia bacterium]
MWAGSGTASIAAIPLGAANQVIGSIGWAFGHRQAFDDERTGVLSRLSADCHAMLVREAGRESARDG